MSKKKYVIEIENLEKSFNSVFKKNKPVISDLTFKVEKSKITGFLGPNGSGKTTTIRIILGFLKANKGTIKVFWNKTKDCLNEKEFKKNIGYLPESPSFFPFFSGRELLSISAEIAGLQKREIQKRVNDVIRRFQLIEFSHRKINTYSQGMIKKLAFAQAVISEPDILILDEPLTNLDPVVMNEIKTYIIEANLSGKSLFISSHLLSEMEKICENVILINKGKKVLCGDLKKLLDEKVKLVINTEDQKIKNFLEKEQKFKLNLSNSLANVILDKDKINLLIEKINNKFSRSISYAIKRPTLEDIFLDSVKRET